MRGASKFLILTSVTTALLSGCGEDAAETSSDESPDPSALRTGTFVAYPPTVLAKDDAEALFKSLDLTNYRASTAAELCSHAKAPFTTTDGATATVASESLDVTSCFAPDVYPTLTDVSISYRAVDQVSLSINGEARPLEGRDIEFAKEALKAADVEAYELTHFSQSITVVSGKQDGKVWRREEKRLKQNGDGKPCVQRQVQDGKSIADPCAHFAAWDVTLAGEALEGGMAVVRNDQANEATAFISPFFDRGATASVSFGNWKGTVVYSGSDAEPEFQLKDDKNGAIESAHFNAASAPALEVATLSARGGCYVGTTHCDIEISYTLDLEDEVVSPEDYEIAYAYAEGATAPASCTDANVTRDEVLTKTLVLDNTKPLTNYAIRACVRFSNGDYSPGMTATAKTPGLISN